MLAAIDDTRAWVRASFPDSVGDGSGFLLAQTWGSNGPVDRTFTPTQTSGLQTQLDALVATVG